jgi:hypothetical protein
MCNENHKTFLKETEDNTETPIPHVHGLEEFILLEAN